MALAAAASVSANSCAYMFSVVETLACPIRRLTVKGSMPLFVQKIRARRGRWRDEFCAINTDA
jgi:hypothetical protein